MSRLAVLAVPLLLATPALAGACPVCESATGTEVRAGVFDAGFLETLGLSALPFALALGVVAAIHFPGATAWLARRTIGTRTRR